MLDLGFLARNRTLGCALLCRARLEGSCRGREGLTAEDCAEGSGHQAGLESRGHHRLLRRIRGIYVPELGRRSVTYYGVK